MTADTIEAIVREMRENGSNPFATGVILTSYCKDWADRLEAIAKQQGGEAVAEVCYDSFGMGHMMWEKSFGKGNQPPHGTKRYTHPSPAVVVDDAMVARAIRAFHEGPFAIWSRAQEFEVVRHVLAAALRQEGEAS